VGRPLVRDMTWDDLDAVVAIEYASFPNPWRRESHEDELRHAHARCKVAVADSSVVGYLYVRVFLGEAHVMKIAVRPDLRRRKIASILTGELVSLFREGQVSRIFLEARASNSVAVKFYEKFGFKAVSRRKRYYSMPDEEAIIMTCEFDRFGEFGLHR